jgi:hypothetical protein
MRAADTWSICCPSLPNEREPSDARSAAGQPSSPPQLFIVITSAAQFNSRSVG